ncbi:MAG: methylated-DNA--[protein]-cysteine S-methyltransferase [Planctomycetes bacterium]|nr:methylated-DNA--[protein]-cysteine S-methyltransferase [Planctomycetota bacterium]MBL7143017.1 methylated-DNA--[protein]-cysteine S-methyltransferase [Phycisphaerae bacterium]
MQKVTKYTIFQTKWGYFGLAGTEYGLCRTQLPGSKPEKIKTILLKNLPNPQYDKSFCKILQQQITAYFEGDCIKFSRDTPLILDGFSSFGTSVLTACREIEIGQTITYGKLAKKAGRTNASRAVGSTLAKNPLPLIIPCHRIIRSDGKMGGFSAPGGIILKKKMLELERKAISI